MTSARRVVTFASALILVFSTSIAGRAAAPDRISDRIVDSTRITTAANATLRALPSPTAKAVAQLPLGTELTDAGPAGLDKTWLRVKASDGREGWIVASLTKPLDPNWRWPTFDRIIADRLGRKGDGFPALVELVTFIERVAPEYTDLDGRARVEFSRLRATAAAAAAIPFKGGARDPYASWLKGRKTDVFYDDPRGGWMLSDRPIWAAHARAGSSPVTDDIAWFAVTNGIGGECEGYLPCYISWRNRLQGEYLRLHPGGKHAEEAVGEVRETIDRIGAAAKPAEAYQFDRGKDCREFTTTMDALTAAVKGTRVANRDATIASLAALRRICQ